MKRCPLCETDYPNQYFNCEGDGAVLVATRDLDPGTVVRNKYRIVRKVGRGGMGTVYLAAHILLGRQRALKFIASELAQDPRLLKRFRLEALAAIELRHPNIAEVVDLDQAEDGAPFIAMEYVEGRDLRAALRDGPMEIERALHIARGVAFGLGAAHAKGIVHRDVKPENILLAAKPDGAELPKLVDFGIAAIQDNVSTLGRTRTGVMLTPDYAAPEQWLGLSAGQIDGRTDLYALGGVLHEMLTGRNWLVDRGAAHAQGLNCAGQRPSLSELRSELRDWPGLEALVLRLLDEDREQRPRDVSEFLRELDAVQKKQPVTRVATVVEDRPNEQNASPRADQRNRYYTSRWMTIVAACLGFVGLVLGVMHWRGVTIFSAEKTGLDAGTARRNPKDGLMYAWIPFGFSIGDRRPADETETAVEKSKGFWMGQTPVTVGAWKKFRIATGAAALPVADQLGRTNLNEGGPDTMPVVNESWEQAEAFCEWAGMTLPSEAHWEYAARAGTSDARYGEPDAIAWYGDNSGNQRINAAAWSRAAGTDRPEYERRLRENGNFAHPVGLKQPNRWRLYDMLGNVLEWTSDSSQDGKKVIRGASWANTEYEVRFTSRTAIDPNGQFTAIGFRCIGQTLPQQPGGDLELRAVRSKGAQ
jgi:serine/threonine protein kinase/formylglycine-generating enzyme required for sulfatase activity